MLVDKLAWVSHNGTSILSIDVQATGPRFATAGLDQKVKVWNLPAALNAKQEADASVPRLLATLTDHFGPVNVARFARKADLLASGSDDKIVCVYELREGTGQRSFGSTEGPSLENWKILHSLRGHSNNITDIAWSPDDTLVASCSLDNTIIVWNVKTGQKVQTLEGHKSYVKGLAWDPIGKYLASEADDRSIIIWRTSDWSVGQVITRPFVAPNSFVSNTFSLRLDWSPDGACLAAVNSFQSPKHTAPMIDRQSWDFQYSMVGHLGAVLCAKHSPKLYYQPGEGGRPPQLASCVALGSQDRKITVWHNTSTRPFCILSKVFKQGPVDLAWVPDGRSFLACSPDGTIALFQFTAEELGQVAPQEVMEKRMKDLYGDMRARPTILAESATQLQLEADAQAKSRPPAPVKQVQALAARLGEVPASNGICESQSVAPPMTAQAETRTRNGRRRIEAVPVSTGIPPPVAQAGPTPDVLSRVLSQAPPRPPPPVPAAATEASNGPPQRDPAPARAGPANGGARTSSVQPSPGRGRGPTAAAPDVGQKRKAPPVTLHPTAAKRIAVEPIVPSPMAGSGARAPPSAGPPTAPPVYPFARQPAAGPISVDLGQDEDCTTLGDGRPGVRRVLEANNGGPPAAPQAQITCSVGGKRIWAETLAGRVIALAGSSHFAAVGFQDGTLQVYSRSGRRMLPKMLLGAAPSFLASDGRWRLLAVCADGSLRLWDLQCMKLITSGSSLPLLGDRFPRPHVVKARLSAAGYPLLVLSDSTASIFHLKMETWMRIADNAFPASSFASMAPSATVGELARVQGEAAMSCANGAAGLPNLAVWQQPGSQASRAHLETRVACAQALESGPEYRRWLLTYVRHLSNEGDQIRLREICEELLGPLRPRTDQSAAAENDGPFPGAWASKLLGLDKRQLLVEVLRDMARNRALQRLASDFQDMLHEAEKPREITAHATSTI